MLVESGGGAFWHSNKNTCLKMNGWHLKNLPKWNLENPLTNHLHDFGNSSLNWSELSTPRKISMEPKKSPNWKGKSSSKPPFFGFQPFIFPGCSRFEITEGSKWLGSAKPTWRSVVIWCRPSRPLGGFSKNTVVWWGGHGLDIGSWVIYYIYIHTCI